MKTFPLTVSSPEGDLFQGNVVKLSVRGSEGELAVMAGHIPFVTYVNPCVCKIELEDGEEKRAQLESGVLSVSSDKVILLAGEFAFIE